MHDTPGFFGVNFGQNLGVFKTKKFHFDSANLKDNKSGKFKSDFLLHGKKERCSEAIKKKWQQKEKRKLLTS